MKKLLIAAIGISALASCKHEIDAPKAPEELYMIQIEEVDKDGVTTTPSPIITVHVQP